MFPTDRRPVLWVKGSGSDLATATRKEFTPLYMDDVLPLMEREAMSDAEMAEYLSNCVAGTGHPRQSIETLLHAFLPFPHVDHTHPDAIIAIACAASGPAMLRAIAPAVQGKVVIDKSPLRISRHAAACGFSLVAGRRLCRKVVRVQAGFFKI